MCDDGCEDGQHDQRDLDPVKGKPQQKDHGHRAASMPQAPSPLDSANPVITLSPPRDRNTRENAVAPIKIPNSMPPVCGTPQGVPDDAEIGHGHGGNGLLFLGEARHKERQQQCAEGANPCRLVVGPVLEHGDSFISCHDITELLDHVFQCRAMLVVR